MSYFITGVSGVGKTTICKKLQELGYTAYDIDDVPELCLWRHKKTGELGDYYPGIALEWLDEHDWICNKKQLTELLKEDGDTFICGSASNEKELRPLFSKIILLTLPGDVMKQRLSGRTGKDDFAKTEPEQLRILGYKDEWEKELLEAGAIPVDANRPLEKVIEEILSHVA